MPGEPRNSRWLWALATLLAVGGVLAWVIVHPRDAPPTPAQREQIAQSRYDAGQYRSAVLELKNLLRDDPSNSVARALLGYAQLALGDSASARKEIEKAIELGATADDPGLYPALAKALLAQRRYQEALDFIRARAERDQPVWLNLEGQALLGLREFDAAVQVFKAVQAVDRDNRDAGLGLILVARERGHVELAMIELQKLLLQSGDQGDLLQLKGELELSQGLFWDARSSFERALALRGPSREPRIGLVRAYLGLGRPEVAAQQLGLITEDAGNSPLLFYLQGVIAREKGDLAGARQAIRAALNLAPGHTLSLLLMGEIQYRTGNLDSARQVLEKVVRDYPDHLAARALLARVQLALDTDAGPVDGEYLGDGSQSANQPVNRAVEAERAQRAAVVDQQAMSILSLIAQGSVDHAIVKARELLDRHPHNAQYHVLVARAYQAQAAICSRPGTTATVRCNTRPTTCIS